MDIKGFGPFSGGEIEHLMAHIKEGGNKEVVLKSIPAKKEWIDEQNRMLKTLQKLKEQMEEVEADKKKLWAIIELDINDFRTNKRFNDETGEIEILGEKEAKKPTSRPLTRGRDGYTIYK